MHKRKKITIALLVIVAFAIGILFKNLRAGLIIGIFFGVTIIGIGKSK